MIGFELPFVSWIFHDERPRVTRRERETFPHSSHPCLPACVNRCTRVVYIDFKRHTSPATISRRRISYSHKRNGDSTFSEKFLSMEMYRPFLFFIYLFFFSLPREKYNIREGRKQCSQFIQVLQLVSRIVD